ncbi:hypothetical protein [Nostoc sp. ATCC 53789]|uniref:hypothetical protein n=1 Tax=Nostoc sp. ATCC 53789 TaxID=76335 RepID=UPI000E019765|nr:hypothetical protein [Nostoc sp. ATCC 53789]RCJ15604.1 hypothetical protein A6V25_09170 [Nostoc sp. ATCC 53789]
MNVISVKKETSLADFVCHVLNICGKKEIVVIVAAANPRIVKKSIAIQTYKLKNSEVRIQNEDA